MSCLAITRDAFSCNRWELLQRTTAGQSVDSEALEFLVITGLSPLRAQGTMQKSRHEDYESQREQTTARKQYLPDTRNDIHMNSQECGSMQR